MGNESRMYCMDLSLAYGVAKLDDEADKFIR